MIKCPNCGHENTDDSRFCANCGTSLTQGGRGGGELPPLPPVTDPSQLPPTSPEWRMSAAGPLPPPPRRPRWLWFLLGIFGLCLLICVGVVIWSQTIGRSTVEGLLATAESALTATAEAGNPSAGTPAAGGTPASAPGQGISRTPVAVSTVSASPARDLPILRLETPTPDD